MAMAADQMWGAGGMGEEGDPKVQLMWLGGVVPVSRLRGQIGGSGPGHSDSQSLKKADYTNRLEGSGSDP